MPAEAPVACWNRPTICATLAFVCAKKPIRDDVAALSPNIAPFAWRTLDDSALALIAAFAAAWPAACTAPARACAPDALPPNVLAAAAT